MSSRRTDWTLAACRDHDPELFFPVGMGELADRQAEAAKAVCACCALVERCLDFALGSGITDGVWGGRTEQERRGLSHRRRRTFPVAAG